MLGTSVGCCELAGAGEVAPLSRSRGQRCPYRPQPLPIQVMVGAAPTL